MKFYRLKFDGDVYKKIYTSKEEAENASNNSAKKAEIIEVPTYEVALCEARHEGLPEESIFPNTLKFDFKELENYADAFCIDNRPQEDENKIVVVYVTGFTPALTTLLKAANKYGVSMVLMHFDRDKNNYVPQVWRN